MDSDSEWQAFVGWLETYPLSRPVLAPSDLSDGVPLFDVLSFVDAEYFRQPARTSTQLADNWVLRLGSLKRLYRLITQYFADVLNQPTHALPVPDLQAVAERQELSQVLAICRLTLTIAVQSSENKDVIERIQKLKQADQAALMHAIAEVMQKLPKPTDSHGPSSMTDDDHYYQLQSERSRAVAEKETLEKVHQALMTEHTSLQSNLDDVTAEKDDALVQLRELKREVEIQRSDKSDTLLRAEIDRLRSELQKSEDNLNAAEADLEKQMSITKDLTRKVEDLQVRADQAAKLKDQVDEYRHQAEKVQKIENVMEKYKKKLEESADLRRTVKTLEEQNASLVDKNASLEEEYRKVSAFKPLMESYKSQIGELESKSSLKSKEIDTLRFELERTQSKLATVEEERAQDAEALELYQERVKELELAEPKRQRVRAPSSATSPPPPSSSTTAGAKGDAIETIGEELEEPATPTLVEDVAAEDSNLGGELDDAVTGRTMTDLKLQIRQLKRELQAAKSNAGGADVNQVIVLENLLEDARRMKSRYEQDYLATHREKLLLQSQLEEIRSGKSNGDGPEAAIALRQRLNEATDELEAIQKEHAQLQVNFDIQSRDLTIAKSDLTLVNKDQLDILATLRESVNEDKASLEADVERLNKQLSDLKEKNKMQLEQVNALLMEKVTLQNEGIGQREKMLARERDFGDLRASLFGNGQPLSEETKNKLLEVHEQNVLLKEQLTTEQHKLAKARKMIKEQDAMIKDRSRLLSSESTFTEAEESFRSERKLLKDEIDHLKKTIKDLNARYQREQEVMLSVVHSIGMPTIREHLGVSIPTSRPPAGGKVPPSSWLAQKRTLMTARLG